MEQSSSPLDVLNFPAVPYPGLRPFRADESALLFGRKSQIDAVLDRLERRQFVAVIGGSGSGKSSLIRAGVVPALRSYHIRAQGDFWVPMVCTPGTNSESDTDLAEHRHADTPLRRMAWKFSRLLRPLDSPQAEQRRVDRITDLLRREAGIGQLIDAYSGQLQTPSGLTGDEARFLIVIDQFEELFHPTNRDAEGHMLNDCSAMVERVIEHFFAAHERCYVVLTMRSEHLNDCAAFLQLPEAINAAFYLVKRLDDYQLREAIAAPAEAYRTVRWREQRPGDRLPERIVFEPGVIDRLLADVRDLAHDPDHLPLLQHALARCWEAASLRTSPYTLPALIDEDDLARAVFADPNATRSQLDGNRRLLRTCLIRHADAVASEYGTDAVMQGAIDDLLRRLAFKDPNTGLYSQQRIEVNASNEASLKALVKNGPLGSANYLHWDDENPEYIKVKVSHESFIRGWPRFRDLIDQEAERFEEFMILLRACAQWRRVAEPQDSAQMLLSGNQLANLRGAGLDKGLLLIDERARWFKFLAFVHDGRRFRALEPDIEPFIRQSLEHEQEQRHDKEESDRLAIENRIRLATAKAENEKERQRASAARARWVAAVVVLSVVGPFALFWGFVDGPVRERAASFIHALKAVPNVVSSPGSSVLDDAWQKLRVGEDAVKSLVFGLSGADKRLDAVYPFLVDFVPFWPVRPRREMLDDIRSIVEPPVNGTLRQLLVTYPWALQTNQPHGSARPGQEKNCPIVEESSLSVDLPSSSLSADTPPPKGMLYVDDTHTRGVWVTDPKPNDPDISWEIRPVQLRKNPDGEIDCVAAGPRLWRSPTKEAEAMIAIDSGLNYLFQIVFSKRPDGSRAGTLIREELRWLPGTNGVPVVERNEPVVFQDDSATTEITKMLLKESNVARRHGQLPSYPEVGGSLVAVGSSKSAWRLFSSAPTPVPAGKFDPLTLDSDLAVSGSACKQLDKTLRQSIRLSQIDVSTLQIQERGDMCFVVQRGRPRLNYTPKDHDAVNVSVYLRSSAAGQDPKPIVGISFGMQPLTANRWYLGKSKGQYAGWIALGHNTESRLGEGDLVGVPWSTEALENLRKSLLNAKNTPDAGAASAAAAGSR